MVCQVYWDPRGSAHYLRCCWKSKKGAHSGQMISRYTYSSWLLSECDDYLLFLTLNYLIFERRRKISTQVFHEFLSN
ncbi:UNVERIFIED_CONTAM: hypothetical protein NCL1_61761 [Trichonephila clavipes]